MKTRISLFLFAILLLPAGLCQARTNIPLVKDVPKGSGDDDRARDPGAPEAWLDDGVLTIDFVFESPTRVVIRERDTQALFYVEYFSSSDMVSINLRDQHIGIGEYQLQVSFAGLWWKGLFSVEEGGAHTVTNVRYVKLDGTYYRLEGEQATTIRPEVVGNRSRVSSFCWEPDYPIHMAIPEEVFQGGVAYPVVGIERGTFRYCYELVSITIPPTVTDIGNVAFYHCNKLQQVSLPASVTRIGINAFCDCAALTSIDIPEGVQTIGEGAFQGCSSLTRITLPESLTRIGNDAFKDISTLTHVYCHAKVPFAIDEHAFNYKCILHVPAGCREDYMAADGWKNFAIIVDNIPHGMTGDETGLMPAVQNGHDGASERLYDLQGHPADGTQPGIYILNGKKVLMK